MALRVGKGCQTYLDALAQTTEIRMFDIVSRNWNDTPIQRRTTDGYVNATAMCKANVKNRLSQWTAGNVTSGWRRWAQLCGSATIRVIATT